MVSFLYVLLFGFSYVLIPSLDAATLITSVNQCGVCVDSVEWQFTNETEFDYFNVTRLQLKAEYLMLVVAINNIGSTASDQIRVVVGMPYAQFGSFYFCFFENLNSNSCVGNVKIICFSVLSCLTSVWQMEYLASSDRSFVT